MIIRHIYTVAAKEFHGYLNSPIGYIFMTVFLVVTTAFFFNGFFLENQSSMRSFFEILPWIFLFLLPAITMRLWSEERKMGTTELLLTAPITSAESVLGKFFASFVFLLVTLILSGVLPAILFFVGQPDFGVIFSGYIGTIFLGASYLAVGLFMSSLTDNQIVAFILSVLFIFILLIIGNDLFLNTTFDPIIPPLKYLSMDFHFKSIVRGVIDSRDLVYYGLLIFLFLYFNVVSLNYRKWK